MLSRFSAFTGVLFCGLAFAQSPEPPHIIDPNLTFGSSAEGKTPLVLPKSITELSFTTLRKQGDDRHDDNGSSFHVKDFRFPDFRYEVLNMGVGLGKGFEVGFTLPYSWTSNPLEAPSNFYTTSNRNGQVLTRCYDCTGASDMWLSLKWQALKSPKLPLVIQSDFQMPEIYRHSEPLLGSKSHEFQLSAWTAVTAGNFWFSPKMGYVWRGNNLGDAFTYLGEVGWRPFGRGRARGFYLRARMDGSEITDGDKTGAKSPRYSSLTQVAAGHYFTYNDAEGTRATLSAGMMVSEWNLELSYARWLRWQNSIGYKEWSLTASRPLMRREFIKGEKILAAPTETEAKSKTANSIVLSPGDIFTSTYFDWHDQMDHYDQNGIAFTTPDGRQHDFRFLTQAASFGLPKGFEIDAIVPYFWGEEQFINSNTNISHTGLNDIWVSVRKQILYNSILPLGIAGEFKFPEATRHADRYLGEDKHDVMFSLFTSKSGPNWWTGTKWGYRWREGAMSDEVDYTAELGWRPPYSQRFRDAYIRTTADGGFSMHNTSAPTSGDRYGGLSFTGTGAPGHGYTFNEGSIGRFGYGFGVRAVKSWNFEWMFHKYYYAANNNAYRRDWTIGFSRWF